MEFARWSVGFCGDEPKCLVSRMVNFIDYSKSVNPSPYDHPNPTNNPTTPSLPHNHPITTPPPSPTHHHPITTPSPPQDHFPPPHDHLITTPRPPPSPQHNHPTT